jgi:hypothetical protein
VNILALRRPCLWATAALILTLLALPTFAQSVDEVEKLRLIIEEQQEQLANQKAQLEVQEERLEAQKSQLDSQQRMLEAQEQLLAELQEKLGALISDEDGDQVAATEQESPAAASEQPSEAGSREQSRVSERSRFDLESPTASNVTYFDPAASAMIPGTQTQVAVHGLVEFQIFHDTTGLNNNRFDTATIPVSGAPSQTKFSVNPSQFGVSSMTPVKNGRLNTWFSIDMNGQLDRPEPRLRIAFGEYVNDVVGLGVLMGQTYSTMLDLRAIPETLDFALPAGLWQQRQPLLRVTNAVGQSMTVEVSAETPESVIYPDDVEERTRWPDLAAAGNWNFGGRYLKHFRLAGMARDLGAEVDGGSMDSALGWALSGSTKLGLPFLESRDSFKLTLHYGDGYGTQIKGGPMEGVWNPENMQLETIGIIGAYGGVQHFWSSRYRSNFIFGHVENDNPPIVEGDTLKNTTYFATNLIWTPFPTTKFGFEYLWGRRKDEDGESGTSSRFLLSSMFRF